MVATDRGALASEVTGPSVGAGGSVTGPSAVSGVTGVTGTGTSSASWSRRRPGAAAQSADEVLRSGQRAVLRFYCGVMFVGSLSAIPFVVFGPTTGWLRTLALIALGMAIALYGVGVFKTREDEAAAITLPLPVLYLVVSVAITLHYCFGFYSGTPFMAMLGVGIMLLTIASPKRDGLFVYVVGAVEYFIVMLLMALEIVPDEGILAGDVTPVTRWISLAGLQIGLGLFYFFGRMVGGYGQQIMDQLQQTVRDAYRREALLREARADLEHAERADAAGLFSELELDGYRLGDVIGRGGMGEVYQATHLESGELAAIKLLRRDALRDREAVQRFAREAAIAAELECDEVVKVLAVGGPEATLPYIAMEFLHGKDLSTLLRQRRRRQLDEVVAMASTVCRGLAAAHERGIVHRDLKPQNIFRAETQDGRRWKILDFGVSKLVGRQEGTLGGGQLVGTPAYMAPEQALGREVDARADIYSLAVVAYRCVTGFPAFPRGTAVEVMAAVIDDMPVDPSSLVNIPEDITAVLRIGLAKNPDDRFPDAAELGEALRHAAEGDLDERWRAQARALTAARPWGRVDDEDEDEPGATRRV